MNNMGTNRNKIFVGRNKKVIIVGSESESDNSSNNVNLSNNDLPEYNGDALRKKYVKRKFSRMSASSSKAFTSDDSMDSTDNGTSTTEHLLKKILKVNMENQKLLHKFVDQQTELINLAKEMKEQFNRNSIENVTPKSDEELEQSEGSDSDTNEPNLISSEQHLALMQEKMPSKLITKAAYIMWGTDELARRSVRFQKNVTERPLSPDKKKVVKRVFRDWMNKNHWPRDSIEEELSRTKMNKYFNGAISAARKRVNYKLKIV